MAKIIPVISYMLSALSDISVAAAFREKYRQYVRWPSLQEWTNFQGRWQKLPFAVGAIDGTSTEIYRPGIEPQEHYYSGNRHYHCIHTQVVITNDGTICYVECGFLGHQNDAQQFMLTRQIGIDLPFPDDLCILGDKIYPNLHPIMTSYTRQQIARKPLNLQQKCRKMKTCHRIPC
jgi:hypothetical protein